MKIGILKESKIPADNRVPLTPSQCKRLEQKLTGVKVIVQPAKERCFTDKEYEQAGITMQQDISDCDVLLGVKEVKPEYLIPDKTYLFFSHTIKKQPYNRELLKTVLKKHIRLIDYETLTGSDGMRLIGFGRWAGLVGAYNGIRAFCIRNHISGLTPAHRFKRLQDMIKLASSIKLPPLKVAVTGSGRVAGGAEEILAAFNVLKVPVDEYLHTPDFENPVYARLEPGAYNKRKTGKDFDLAHFFKHPETYSGNFSRFCKTTDLLIMAAYWDPRAPVLFNIEEMRKDNFRIRTIADITCDINGSVPSSIRTTTHEEPYYDFNPQTEKEEEAFSNPSNITVMTIDNLPCGLPRAASVDFGTNLINKVIPRMVHGDEDDIITRATIAAGGKLTAGYNYLSDWVSEPT
jgi:saccharopine dehydrogenase (NAD+, L-lysine-forming)